MKEQTNFSTCSCQTDEQPSLARRNFLLATSTITVSALAGCSQETMLQTVKNTALTKERRDELSPDDLIRLAKEGNERFRKGEQRPRDFLAEQQSSAQGQYRQ
jgi:carbonic anhydrase